MPRYEFRCRTCGDTFEVSRPMARSSDPASCPAGHDDTVPGGPGGAGGGPAGPAPAPPGGAAGGGGGCCGGGCCG
ncbi:FmdB family zinc ribbon protein [Streptomyces californicus]|uniref:FmdB family zinc ribbon protein n=1 Tax=Streptomyces californicus TaxID=67351 RepID=UPI00368A7659